MTRSSREFDLSPQRLRHIRWIGGGSGAGKSTVARLLAEEYGLHLYQCDDTQSVTIGELLSPGQRAAGRESVK